MTGREPGVGGEDARHDAPGPAQRRWIHPSELPAEPPPTPPAAPGPSRHRIAVPLTAGLAGALAAFGFTALVLGPSESDVAVASSTTRPLRTGAGPASNPTGIAALAQAAGPALVGIAAWTGPQVRYGSGIAYREDGLVVTAASLVEQVTAVEVSAADGRTAPAELVGVDPDNELALLRTDLSDLATLTFAESAPAVLVGDGCALLGAAHAGQEGPWAARGVIAAVGKVVEVDGHWMVDVFEVDARLDAAGVGGALVDGSGSLLGVLTDAGDGALTGTLAVPVGTARRSAEQLLARGHVEHPWIGLATMDTAAPVRGALVQAVHEEGPASDAGLLAGDVVVDVAGRHVRGMTTLLREVRRREVGETVVLGVVRDGERLEVTVTLAPRPRATMER